MNARPPTTTALLQHATPPRCLGCVQHHKWDTVLVPCFAKHAFSLVTAYTSPLSRSAILSHEGKKKSALPADNQLRQRTQILSLSP